MKRFLGVLRIAVILFLALVLGGNLWLLGSRVLLKRDMPKLFGYSHAVVLSGSMEPLISPGDLLFFKENKEYVPGDIVIFRQDNVFITHRITERTDAGFVTQGDANDMADLEMVRPSQIEGRLKWILPGVGNAVKFLRTPLGILILAVTGLLMLELPGMIDLLKQRIRRGKR